MKKKRIKPVTCIKPKKFGEISTTVFGVRIPKSKEKQYRKWHLEEIKPLIKAKLKNWEVNKDETPNL